MKGRSIRLGRKAPRSPREASAGPTPNLAVFDLMPRVLQKRVKTAKPFRANGLRGRAEKSPKKQIVGIPKIRAKIAEISHGEILRRRAAATEPNIKVRDLKPRHMPVFGSLNAIMAVS